VLLVVGLGAVATHLGFEAILGAFIAGAILRLVDADAEHKHPLFHPKLDAIGYGFLIPVFFITSGWPCWSCADCPPSSTGPP
jgi:Kef-type K+ transport system membrane component KefB